MHTSSVRVREASDKVGTKEQDDGKRQRPSTGDVWESRDV